MAALARARRNIERMRISVMEAAISGILTGSNSGNWTVRRLSDVVTIAGGQTPRGLEVTEHGPVPFYKVGDMNAASGNYMAESRNYVDQTVAKRFGLHIRPAGTVIFPKRGGAIATNKKRILKTHAAYDLNTMGLVPGADISSGFLYLWISSIDLNRLADGSSVPQINNSDLSGLTLQIPSKIEQDYIVTAAQEALSQVDLLTQVVSRAERRSARIRASILAAAFSGRLVPHSEDTAA